MLTIAEINIDTYPELAAFLTADTESTIKSTYAELKKKYKFFKSDSYEIATVDVLEICAILGYMRPLNFLLDHPGLINTLFPRYRHNDLLLTAFKLAVYNGQLDVVNRLLEFNVVQEAIASNKNEALRLAIKAGYPSIVYRLLEFPAVRLAIAVDNNEPLRLAAESGHLGILNRLLSMEAVQASIAALDNAALFAAAQGGHLAVVNRLLEFATVRTALATSGSRVLSIAATYNRADVVNHLLAYPDILAYAELHDAEFGERYIYPFIQAELQTLTARQSSFAVTPARRSFDIEPEEVPFYFYVLRNLIRRNRRTLDASITQLLRLPSLIANLHLPMNNGESNELLRLAMRVGNTPAATALLGVQGVYATAEAHRFYESEYSQVSLRTIAADRESAMRALNESEQHIIQRVITHYRNKMTIGGGIEEVFSSFKALLKQRYEASPAFIFINGARRALPFEWKDFNAMRLNKRTREVALRAYYQHESHTAYRYLSIPNRWIAEDASYVCVKENDLSFRYASFENYIPLIAYLWLAVSDREMPAIGGYTLQGRIDLFIKELSLLGRAHNWDKTRPKLNTAGRPVRDRERKIIMEEYDDLEGDKPSCYSGVPSRLFQSVLGHPFFTQLTTELLKQELYDFIRTTFKSTLTAKTNTERQAISAAINEVFTVLEKPSDLLKALNITPEQKTAWIEKIKVKYGAQFNENPQFLAIIEHTLALASDEAHVTKFYESHQLAVLLKRSDASEKMAQDGKRNHAFYFNCLAGISAVVGGALLVTGILLLQPAVIAVGGLLTCIAAYKAGASCFSFFTQRERVNHPPDLTEVCAAVPT